MSNRRKAKKPWLGSGRRKANQMLASMKGTLGAADGMIAGHDVETGETIHVPFDERIVNKTVPAVIHFKDWDQVDRDDDEIIGETVIYEDGSFEMVINRDISVDAQSIVNFLHGQNPLNVSLAEEEPVRVQEKSGSGFSIDRDPSKE